MKHPYILYIIALRIYIPGSKRHLLRTRNTSVAIGDHDRGVRYMRDDVERLNRSSRI